MDDSASTSLEKDTGGINDIVQKYVNKNLYTNTYLFERVQVRKASQQAFTISYKKLVALTSYKWGCVAVSENIDPTQAVYSSPTTTGVAQTQKSPITESAGAFKNSLIIVLLMLGAVFIR